MKSILFSLTILFSLFFSHLALAQKSDEKSAGCLRQECHPNSQQEIDVSVHSNGFLRQRQATVEITCFTCHLDHKKDNPQVANQPIARGTDIETCGNCHSKERRIFFSTYHGKHLALGKGNNPTCVYCHAGHELPRANVLSPINPKNIGRICAGCHGGDEKGKQKMAAALDSAATGHTLYRKDVLMPLVFKGGYSVLTLALAVFALLCGVELARSIRKGNRINSSRLPKAMVLQIVLFVLFYLPLDSSGITLLYAHEHGNFISKGMVIAGQLNMQFFQNADFRSLVHRLAALLLIILFMAHLIYLWRSRAFRQFVRWTKEDSQAVKEELRLRQGKKTLWKRKWTYFQMFFLVVVMLITGILQWQAFTVMKYLPFKVVRYADIIHEWNGRLLTMYTYGILIGFFGILRPLMRRLGRQRIGGAAKAVTMLVLLVLLLSGMNSLAQEKKFTSTEKCKSCHEEVYNEWKQSFHAQSVKTPTFAAMLTIFNYNTQGKNLEYCFKCHAPEVKEASNPKKASYKLAQQALQGKKIESEGITCAVCHSIESVKDEPSPEVPVEFDVGKTPPYHKVRRTPLFFRQELCGSCHDYNNPNFPHPQKPSTPCCDVNRDWKKTSFAQKNTTCQSCHMRETMGIMKPSLSTKVKNILFSLTGLMRYRDERERVSHLFPGGRSQEMLKKAVVMDIESKRQGNTLQTTVAIKNLTGHSIPNG